MVPEFTALLPELSLEEEAVKLGVKQAVRSYSELRRDITEEESRDWFLNAGPLEIFALVCRARAEGISLQEKVRDVLTNRVRWSQHYENYKYAYLFAIKRGKPGIRKYFAGWRVFCGLAASNIRYLLELVDQTLTRHFDEGRDPQTPVSHEIQTKVAQDIGQRNLRELEGLSVNGVRLTRLLLGLGRVFQVLAADPVGHTPEVNQFCLDADVADAKGRQPVNDLLTEGIMNLALLRHSGSKLQEPTEIRQCDYTIHPIFAAFFEFSHRRKRKIRISDHDFLGLVNRPGETIGRIVGRQNRTIDNELDRLPEQMRLFERFYAADR